MDMKPFTTFHSKWLIPVSMLIAPFAPGIEAPEDAAAPPAVAGEQKNPIEAMPLEETAFIGLVSGPMPELLSTHLGIREGEGVLVRSVMPDGPAATAGIQASDIIVSVDGKSAMSPAELSNIIRSHKPGDKVKVGLIQAGKGTELDVTLGARPDQVAQMQGMRPGNPGEAFRMQGMPEDMAERLRDMIEGNMMQFQFDGEGIQPGFAIPDIQKDVEQLREQMDELRQQQQGALNLKANSTVRLMDDKGSVELSTDKGESKLTVRDKDNQIEWQGPWTTEEDKAKAPEAIRERAGNLKMNGGGFKFQFGR